MYEQDWLYTEFIGVNKTLLRSATLGRQWLMQMDRGVHEYNLGLQLCMAWPRHVLQSLEMPSVTQGRGSPDYVRAAFPVRLLPKPQRSLLCTER